MASKSELGVLVVGPVKLRLEKRICGAGALVAAAGAMLGVRGGAGAGQGSAGAVGAAGAGVVGVKVEGRSGVPLGMGMRL